MSEALREAEKAYALGETPIGAVVVKECLVKGATIVGTKSFGKGKVQTTGELEDGTMIKYTSARWYMPNGECIDEVGLEPDVNVELDDN